MESSHISYTYAPLSSFLTKLQFTNNDIIVSTNLETAQICWELAIFLLPSAPHHGTKDHSSHYLILLKAHPSALKVPLKMVWAEGWSPVNPNLNLSGAYTPVIVLNVQNRGHGGCLSYWCRFFFFFYRKKWQLKRRKFLVICYIMSKKGKKENKTLYFLHNSWSKQL